MDTTTGRGMLDEPHGGGDAEDQEGGSEPASHEIGYSRESVRTLHVAERRGYSYALVQEGEDQYEMESGSEFARGSAVRARTSERDVATGRGRLNGWL